MIIRINEKEGIVTLEWANNKETYRFDNIVSDETVMVFTRKGACTVEVPLTYGVRIWEAQL